jgi:putative transposase
VAGMVDYRARRRMPPHGRADAAVVAAMRQAIGEAAGDSTRTAAFVFRRTREILAGAGGETGTLPSERTLYRLFGRLEAGRHTTGSASTRRSLAARPEGPFGQVPAAAPGDVMQIDSTPLDVLVRLDSGVPDRVDLTGIIDVATRTVTAAVLRPATKSVDASVLLARTVTPEPMRPGWPQAMRMAASALPFRRMLSIDERLEHAAARPVIIPQVIVVDHGKVFVSESFKASCAFLGISFQPARKATGTDKPHIERMLGSVATMFAQYVSGYTGRSPEYRGRGVEKNAVWSLPELQDLLDQWLIAEWQNRPHDGLRDPLHPGRAFSPNQKYAALIETAGYVPLALSPDDYIELLPATWRAVNAYGIKISRRVYDGKELNPLRMQHSGVTARKGLHEVHCDPYDISRVWVRDHWNGGWITVFWTQLHRVAAPFGELAWDHARKLMPAATEAELADAVQDLLTRAGQGPGGRNEPALSGKRDRRVAGRTRAAGPAMPVGPEPEPGGEPAAEEPGSREAIVPMPIFDPFREAEKWR